MSLQLASRRTPDQRYEAQRRRFISDIESAVGISNIRAGFLPHRQDARTVVCPWTKRVWTAEAQISLRQWGKGYFRHFNLTSTVFTTPDTDNLSFTTGAADQAFSGVAYIENPGNAAFQSIYSKYGGAVGEYEFRLDNGSPPKLQMLMQSGATSPTRLTNTTLPTSEVFTGLPMTVGWRYNGVGGASNMDGVLLYVNGVAVAATSTNDAGYTFMANTTDLPAIGARGTGAVFYRGGIGFVLVVAGQMTAAEHAMVDGICRWYFTGGY